MATTTRKLQLKFGTMSGTKTWTFNGAPSSLSDADVVTFMNTMIENGAIYKYPPLTRESAKIITTTENEISV